MSEHEAPSAIMWAIKDPDGHLHTEQLHDTEYKSKLWFAFGRWSEYEEKGYRCVRVRITEVQDGA